MICFLLIKQILRIQQNDQQYKGNINEKATPCFNILTYYVHCNT